MSCRYLSALAREQRAQPRRDPPGTFRRRRSAASPRARVVQAAAVQQRHENRADARKRFVFSHFSFFLLRDGAGVGARRPPRVDQTRRRPPIIRSTRLVFESRREPVAFLSVGSNSLTATFSKNASRHPASKPSSSWDDASTLSRAPSRTRLCHRAGRDRPLRGDRGGRLECPRMFRDIDNSIDARDVFITRVGFEIGEPSPSSVSATRRDSDSKDASVPTLDAVVSSASANSSAVMFTTPGWSNPREHASEVAPGARIPRRALRAGGPRDAFRIFRISLNTRTPSRRVSELGDVVVRVSPLLPPRRETAAVPLLLTKYFGSKKAEARTRPRERGVRPPTRVSPRAPRARRRTPAR